MIKFNSYDNENKKQLQVLCLNSVKVMRSLCKSMFEFCLEFLALIHQQGKQEMLLRADLGLTTLYFGELMYITKTSGRKQQLCSFFFLIK